MTREEAKRNLIHAIRWNDMPNKEALDMAIKALEQQPCEDCISRHAAVDTINALHEKPNAWLDLAVDAVMALPSAIPQQKIGQWIKSQDCYGNNHFTCPFAEMI